jgi:TolA-binding protein
LAQETGDSSLHRQSIVLFERITTTYPQHPLAEDALLLKGFVLENHLKDISAAKAAYQEVIAKYPTGELAEEAKLSIENLGVEPAEIVKKFQSDTIK